MLGIYLKTHHLPQDTYQIKGFLSNMYTPEQKGIFYKILGGESSSYSLTVVREIIVVDSITLNCILNNSYIPIINTYPKDLCLDDPLYYSWVSDAQRINMLNSFVNTVKFKKVSIYINSMPEAAKWRLLIGV